MKNWHDDTVTISNECPWLEDSNDAMIVAEKLNIPFNAQQSQWSVADKKNNQINYKKKYRHFFWYRSYEICFRARSVS